MQLGDLWELIPVPGYLIQTADGTNVLVDSGLPPDAYRPGAAHAAPQASADWVVNRLAEIGLAPADVDLVVASHFDEDHAGNHDLFPQAKVVVQRAHLAAVRAGTLERYHAIRPRWDRPKEGYRLVDGDVELLPGIGLIESSGHVPGHQAVLVRLPETGPVLLAVDAIPIRLGDHAPEDRPLGPYDLDEAGVRASTRKLVDLAAREGAWIIHGHDAEQWAELRKSPEFYA
jgi:N-acyl homoserine lactone hydrolase